MTSWVLVGVQALSLLATPLAAEAQQPSKVPRIGFLATDTVVGSGNRLVHLRHSSAKTNLTLVEGVQ